MLQHMRQIEAAARISMGDYRGGGYVAPRALASGAVRRTLGYVLMGALPLAAVAATLFLFGVV